jgi:type 1 fimbria pilin
VIRATNHFLSVATLALATLLVAVPAKAADLTIHFKGRFIEPTCDMTVKDVDLGEASVSDFTGAFSTAWVGVPISFANCAKLTTRASLSFSGTADAVRADVYMGKPGVGVELRTQPNGTLLGPGSAAIDVALSSGGATANYVARMTQTTSDVTPGAISTPVTVSVTYH